MERKPFEVVALIPALNEENTIGSIVKKTKKFVDLVIVIDDCSNDRTVKYAKKAGAIVVSTNCRRRIGGVIKTGIDYIKKINPKYLVILDADGQHDPKNIPIMLDCLKNRGVDCIIGSRFLYNVSNNHHFLGGWYFRQKKHVYIKGFGNWFFNKLVSLLTLKYITDVMSGFKVVNNQAIKSLELKFDYAYCPEMFMQICYNGLKISEVPLESKPRNSGVSKVVTNISSYGLKQLGIIFFTYLNHLISDSQNVRYDRK